MIARINAGVDTLISECKRGRQIEVALWLWNLSHLDVTLQNFLDSLEPSQRVHYESLYTDRNEALLYLSKKLPDVLKNYRESLGANIKAKKRISLLRRSREVAMSQLARMARQLSSPIQMALPFDSGTEAYISGLYSARYSPDSHYLQKATTDLEQWLAGVTKTVPSFLSEREGKLLKLLYSHPGRLDLVAKFSKMPLTAVKRELKVLETKVSLYLGVAPS